MSSLGNGDKGKGRKMITTRLDNGLTVLGKLYKGEVTALAYANRTQARKKADEIGGTVYHRQGPFYVALPTARKTVTP